MDRVNINVGVLGHVDCGKTSLCKSLSSKASTAAFDKNPQSRERGITLDLGFSTFTVPAEPRPLQFTLVDCPGHSSLLKTIICGASIIDICLLVVDASKGFQAQTAECLILAELTCPRLVIVLNKVDLVPTPKDHHISLLSDKINKIVKKTKFKSVPIVPVSATSEDLSGLAELSSILSSLAHPTPPGDEHTFLMAVDHCFTIGGRGTVLTGTVLSGTRKIGQNVHVASLNSDRRILSIQSFGTSIDSVDRGDRAAVCLPKLNPKSIERSLLCWPPSAVRHSRYLIAHVTALPYYKRQLRTKSHLHIAVINQVHPAKLSFFESPSHPDSAVRGSPVFDFGVTYDYVEDVTPSQQLFCLLDFGTCPTLFYESAFLIGFNFESGNDLKCRIALSGHVLQGIGNTIDQRLRVLRRKSKTGVAERVCDDQRTIICRGLFSVKSEFIDQFAGFRGKLSTGEVGVIEGPFGTTGKVRVEFDKLSQSTLDRINSTRKKPKWRRKQGEEEDPSEFVEFCMDYFKRVFISDKRVYQY